ncbi:MAG: hypothetical protein E7672_02980 [Ruminococcaceae bacterium]|nr:hypothetical protein [Oscillospiraceae bacterium]
MNIKKIVSVFLTLITILSALTVSANAAWDEKVDENGDPIIDYLLRPYYNPEDKLGDMILVRDQNGFELWYEEFTGEVAIRDKATGVITFSNPYDISAPITEDQFISDEVKQQLLSQVIITFLDNGVEKTMNSYEEAALRGQITMKNIKNGIRVEYILGEEAVQRLVPRVIRKDRFEEKILANIPEDSFDYLKLRAYFSLKDVNDPTESEQAIAAMIAKFPITLEMPVWVCQENISAAELRICENIIKKYCPLYTREELEYDHEITGYTGLDAAPPRFRLALEYTLSDEGLEVRLPANGIEFDESTYQFQNVSILPYFGAGTNEFKGYTVIPDGSGSLIRYEDFKDQAVYITTQMYGPDYAYHEITGQHSEIMRMPYYGAVTNVNRVALVDPTQQYDIVINNKGLPIRQYRTGDPYTEIFSYNAGFVAIITEGDSLASINAECGGTSHPYNTVYPQFTPRPSDTYNLADSISVSGNEEYTVTSKRKYTDSYRIKYIFLRDEEYCESNGVEKTYDTTWVGMATAYRDYLTNNGTLTKLDNTKDDIPLFIETFGSIQTVDRVLTFPVNVDTPLTTFEDVKTMYNELTELGVGNVNFKLTGYANGGLTSTVPYNLKWTKVLGGAEGFEDLVKFAEENNFNVYPDFDFTSVIADEAFDGFAKKDHAVRTIDDRYTVKRNYDAATQSFTRTPSVIISASVYEYLYDHFSPLYTKHGNNSISVSSLGYDLSSDFDEDEPYHREDSKNFTTEVLEKMDSEYENVMVEGGNAYTIKYADVILNSSLTSSQYNKASESIPFLGFVYHGSKVFTGPATNMEGDINTAILNAIENGAAMYYILSYDNTNLLKDNVTLSKYYSVSYDIWKKDVAEYYTILNNATKDLQESYIIDHEFLAGYRVPDEDELLADQKAKEEEEAAYIAQKTLEYEKTLKELRRKARLEGIPLEDLIEDEAPEISFLYNEAKAKEKYLTTSGSIVRVEYEGGVNFILNYNSYDVTTEFDGETYTVPALRFIRID